MIWALVVTILAFDHNGARAIQTVEWHLSAEQCSDARVKVADAARAKQPLAQVIIGCVPMVKPQGT